MAAGGFGHLTLDERRCLFRMHEARLGVTAMAARLGRHRSTIYRELRRNCFCDPDATRDRRRDMSGYYPMTAQDLARSRRQRLAKLARHEDLLAHVVDRLRAGWSPQQIAGRLRQRAEANGESIPLICHETIYRHVYGPGGRAEDLYLCLPRARRRRAARRGRRPRGHRIPKERGIASRPADVATRDSFGHWEGDLLVFARDRGPANVTTLVERRSRYLVLLPNPDRRPAGVAARIGAALGDLSADLRRTVTFDRGFEFMGYPALDRSLGTTSYFCDPRSPWQKGAVENANGRLRRHLPSDTPPELLAGDSLQLIANRFNATPRRCLGYQTPAEVFTGRLDPNPARCDAAAALSHLG